MSKIGIIGDSGYIGFNLASYLHRSFHVKVIDLKSPTGNLENSEYVRCDVRNFEEVKTQLKI